MCLLLIATDERDPVVSYWCRLYGLQTGLKLSTKQPGETALFIGKINNAQIPMCTVALTTEYFAHTMFSYDGLVGKYQEGAS